ncbi:MAG TPA: hypothetical protein VKP10_05835 [Gemmatimonadales bacterium]|nr:hypothetical protein [Gemmatimonadales bacterium]
MQTRMLATMALIALAVPLAAQTPKDTGFAALQQRGKMVMGVDQYTSLHRFDDLPDGGRIILTRSAVDTAGVRTIRAHLSDIARAFAAGDFGHTMAVHQHELPGTAIMRERRTAISYRVDTLPGGGAVRITTRDTTAVRAIHQFLAAQRGEHHAGGATADSGAVRRP